MHLLCPHLEVSFDEVGHTSIGHQRSHQPHLVRLCTWEALDKQGFPNTLENELPPYQQQRLQGKAGCWHVEIASSFPPENNVLSIQDYTAWYNYKNCRRTGPNQRWHYFNFSGIQTSWLMWIIGSSASLSLMALSTTYLKWQIWPSVH